VGGLLLGVTALAVDRADPGGLTWAGFALVAAVLIWVLGRAHVLDRRLAGLAASEARFRSLVQQGGDVTLIVTPEGQVTYASPSVAGLAGLSTAEVEGRPFAALVHPDEAASLGRFLKAAEEGHPVTAEWRLRRGAEWVWTENDAVDLRHEPAIDGLVIRARDISDRRSLEARLTHQAYHDSLTRLANRSLFLNRVAHAIARWPRDRKPAAVLFLDLDGFKKVNDSLGHAAGDELLVACAARLASCIRPGDTIARLGGDEFAVLLEGIVGIGDAEVIAERIAKAVADSFTIQGREVFVGVSAGIAEISGGLTPDEVLRNADLAMYYAKSGSKGRHAVYQPAMHAELVEWLELEADLRLSVGGDQITVEYQPIVHLLDGRLYGAEALVRWTHPVRGHIPTTRFVAMAEETGLIVPLGRRVLLEACTQAATWRRGASRASELRLSVNLSGRHFEEPSLVSDVAQVLSDSALAPGALTLEITESVLMRRSEETLATLRELKALGVKLAIDDFGVGYSSLGYLQQFPIDVLKIDRTFVDSVAVAGRDPVLARAIIALGNTLGMETIAEGIERLEQRDGLRALGCALGQGYFFSRAVPPAEFERRLLVPRPPRATPGGVRSLRPTPVT
jgi:diguanylate cyclase (GGDEF)-like protein/PAS domain S-box-containing protein